MRCDLWCSASFAYFAKQLFNETPIVGAEKDFLHAAYGLSIFGGVLAMAIILYGLLRCHIYTPHIYTFLLPRFLSCKIVVIPRWKFLRDMRTIVLAVYVLTDWAPTTMGIGRQQWGAGTTFVFSTGQSFSSSVVG